MKKIMSGLAIAAIASTAFVGAVAAQTDTASGGNGGVSTSNANGGGVTVGSTNTGGGSGGSTSVGGSSGGSIVLGEELLTGENLAATIIASLGLGD